MREALPSLQSKFQPDVIIANGENSAGGFGITRSIFEELLSYGVSVVTTGNHWLDKREVLNFKNLTDRLVLPFNMVNVTPKSKGVTILSHGSGVRYAVVNLCGRYNLDDTNQCPLHAIDEALDLVPNDVRIRFVDFHAEATSEKQALGHYLSGRASLVYGTHTHCPTADERILNQYTGFVTDVGMTGGYDSVIGMDKDIAIQRMLGQTKKKFSPAKTGLMTYAVFAEICAVTGQCLSIRRIREAIEA